MMTHLIHSMKSILCYKEEEPVSMNEVGLKFNKNHYFFMNGII